MPRGANKSRAGTAALLFVLCLGSLLTALHELNSPHRFCAEHQAVEEGGAEGWAETGSPASHPAASTSDAAAAHEGCPLVQGLASKFEIPRLPQAAAHRPAATASDQPPANDTRLSSLALLRLAPKTSPPTCA